MGYRDVSGMLISFFLHALSTVCLVDDLICTRLVAAVLRRFREEATPSMCVEYDDIKESKC